MCSSDLVVIRQPAHDAREFLPHRDCQRVELGRVVDGDGGDDAVAADVDGGQDGLKIGLF